MKGLMPGERIVISGNFLIDSESRMRAASSGMSGTAGIDPACGMMVDQGKSKTAGLTSDYKGKTYFFCSIECKKQFDTAPQRSIRENRKCPKARVTCRKAAGSTMINRIIDFSANNRIIILILVAMAALAGWWSMHHLTLDAIPDLSDTQVIIYSRWDRSPDIIEDQVTYPIVTAMLGSPRVKSVRGFSDFGYSFVYVIFEEGTDIYWARSRTQEYLSGVLQRLPQGVRTELGPDATGLGWIFQYALVDTSGRHSLADLRSYQDWYLRYYLKSVPGVAEVAPLGGFGSSTR